MSMSRRDRWGDMLSLRDAIDQLLRERIVQPATLLSQRSGIGGMPLDPRETGDDYIVRATTPGVKPDDVYIQINGDAVTIRGNKLEKNAGDQEGTQAVRDPGIEPSAAPVYVSGSTVAYWVDSGSRPLLGRSTGEATCQRPMCRYLA